MFLYTKWSHEGGAELLVHSFLNHTLDVGKWIASRPDNNTVKIP